MWYAALAARACHTLHVNRSLLLFPWCQQIDTHMHLGAGACSCRPWLQIILVYSDCEHNVVGHNYPTDGDWIGVQLLISIHSGIGIAFLLWSKAGSAH